MPSQRTCPGLAGLTGYLFELAARLRVRIKADDAPLAAFAELRLCLSRMGGTPADRSRVEAGDGEPDENDRYFN